MRHRWYHTLRWLSLGASLLLPLGCTNTGATGAESILRLRTTAGTVGYDEPTPPQACVWVIGRAMGARVLITVLAHGGITVEECSKLFMLQDK